MLIRTLVTRARPSRLLTLTPKPTYRLVLTPTRLYASTTTTTPMAAESDTISDTITPTTLTASLHASPALQPLTHVSITDISGGCGSSFAAVIVSDAFAGKSSLQRVRLVNGVLKEEIARIHAWTPRCLTGEQWAKECGKSKEQ